MIKIIITTLLSIFLITCAVVVFYWRDAGFDPSKQDLLLYLGLLPLGISALVLSPYLLWKFYHYKKNKALQQQLKKEQEQAATHDEYQDRQQAVELLSFQVFSTALQNAHGENATLFDKALENFSPNLDAQLVNAQGIALLAHRIEALDEALLEQFADEPMSDLQKRVMVLLAQQFNQHIESIYQIAEHLRQSALFYDRELAYAYRMHPAWINPDFKAEEVEIALTTAPEVPRLNRLNIHVVLAENMLHLWDEALSSEYLKNMMFELGVIQQQVQVEYHYWSAQNAYHKWIELVQQIQKNDFELSLLLVADSELDQDLLDDRLWSTQAYVPAEFAASCCIAPAHVQVLNLKAHKTLNVVLHQNNLAQQLKQLGLEQLPQYDLEEPCVVIADDITQVKTIQKVSKNFAETPIESYHFLYSRGSLGHSQNLATIYSFILGLQVSDDKCSLVYSSDEPTTQVIITAADQQHILSEDL
ncbi:hypothetical protein [Acinetobacter larvae]|uniref:Uncharacterized protein n=1 Tax=Acinetobacter larvae TaxID=1789224 RepID=A0A1B2M0V7_9GAMM|nr:hypothetical protein [Acinetobacter larvae]AOA58836.1 hypothetical protein BFG52_11055 [Acinetobacter larvae]